MNGATATEGITRKELAALLDRSERTLRNILPPMERSGEIVPVEVGQGTRPTIYNQSDVPKIAAKLRIPPSLEGVEFWDEKGT